MSDTAYQRTAKARLASVDASTPNLRRACSAVRRATYGHLESGIGMVLFGALLLCEQHELAVERLVIRHNVMKGDAIAGVDLDEADALQVEQFLKEI